MPESIDHGIVLKEQEPKKREQKEPLTAHTGSAAEDRMSNRAFYHRIGAKELFLTVGAEAAVRDFGPRLRLPGFRMVLGLG